MILSAITMHIGTSTKLAFNELLRLENFGQYNRSCLVKNNNSKQERGRSVLAHQHHIEQCNAQI